MADEQTNEPAGEPAGRPPGKRARKATTSPAPTPPGKVARQIKIPADVDLKLQSHALGTGRSVSAVVVDLVRAMPTEYVLHRRRVGESEGADPPALAIVSEAG
jgi:hypothetical protein